VAPGSSIGTMTLAGNYVANGGTLEVEVVLGDETSPTDLLVVQGDTVLGTGPTQVEVVNLGGTGAVTAGDGILIVEVDGASPAGVFELDAPLDFGAFSYDLYHNGIADPGDGNWYLRTSFLPTTPTFEALPQVLLTLFDLPSLQQRVGNRAWSGAGAVGPAGLTRSAPAVVERTGVWARIVGAHAAIEPDEATSGARYEANHWLLQGGFDVGLHDSEAGRLVAGLSGHYGEVDANIFSSLGDGAIDAQGYGVGGTLTWYGQSGFYVDGQARATWLDADLDPAAVATPVSGIDGFGYGLSLEAGMRLGIDAHVSVTPQAQLTYAEVDFDSFTDDSFGTRVSLDDGDTLTGRLGISADIEQAWRDDAGRVERLHLYGIANLFYGFDAKTTVDVSGTGFESEVERLWGGLGAGATLNFADDAFSLYGEAAMRASLADPDSYVITGTAGVRVAW
jgi:fibronectin-binding autotransporter adhesin